MNISQLILSQHFATACAKTSSSVILPTWYEYLNCNNGSPVFNNINDVWLIVAAVIEILLRLAALIAVGFIIYAGIQYSTSQGNPDTTRKALSALLSAVIGLLICVASAALVAFIAGSFN